MFTLAQRDELLRQFEAEAKTNYENATPKVREAMKNGEADHVREGIKFLQQLVIAAIPENIPVPKVSLYVNSSGVKEITLVNIAMSNRVNAPENFKYRCAFGLTEDVNEKMFRFLQEVYADLIVIELVKFNLKTVNDVLARASAEAGLQYSIRVIPAIGSAAGKKIMSMSDDEIVFVANTERTLELDDMIIFFQEPDEVFSEEDIKAKFDKLVQTLSSAQTPEQLVGIHGGDLLSFICDISKRVKPSTLIKAVCTKDVNKLRGDNDAIAYYQDGSTFALVARRDGGLEVILSPFDLNDLHRVNVDVLGAIV